MSQLESRVERQIKAVMDGEKVRLTRGDAESLIRWCQKTAAMFDVFTPDPPVVRSEVFAALASGEAPPGTWDIRVARVNETAYDCYSHCPYVVQPVLMSESATLKAGHPMLDESVIGVQSLIVVGPIVFMVRYSPHRFRGSASIDADYFMVGWPPGVLLNSRGGRSPNFLKPGGWPVYSQEDLQRWSLWVVTRHGVPVGLCVDEDGTSWVDDITNVLGDDWEIVESERTPIDVAEHFRNVVDD